MRIVMMACTERGFSLMKSAAENLSASLPEAEILQTGRCTYVPGFMDGPRLSEVTSRWFAKADALVFFTAAGIAVRCVAPFVGDKWKDPAVLVIDEGGKYCISLLSGHAGGGNRLCGLLAEAAGAHPVITTATDGRDLFAVDVFSSENGFALSDRALAKRISARLLAGETVSIFYRDSDLAAGPAGGPALNEPPHYGKNKGNSNGKSSGRTPAQYGKGIRRTTERPDADIIISERRLPGDPPRALYLIPPAVTLGIGCRRGVPAERIRQTAEQILRQTGVFREALCGIASIDLKREEDGLLRFAESWGLPLTFFSARELNALQGNFTASAFVEKVTGTDSVCERSALCLAGEGGILIAEKMIGDGVTASLGMRVR